MYRVVGVKYKHGNKVYNFDAQVMDLKLGDTVIVDSDQGIGAAVVAEEVREEERGAADKPLKRVIRKANADDMERLEAAKEKEAEAYSVCQKKIMEREMVMKLVRVEWAFDNSKATFYFTADGRVDFRDLVRDLAHRFKIRIEMRQIGVRDEAKMIGGFGPCGRELCCSTFLKDFEPVSIKMAKKQDLVLNPAKISGTCGRLMCCLGYEYSFYDEIKKCERRQRPKPAPEEPGVPVEAVAPEAAPEAAPGAQEKHDDKARKKRSAWRKKRGKGGETAGGEGQQPRQEKQAGQPGQPGQGEPRKERPPREPRPDRPEKPAAAQGQEPGKGEARTGRPGRSGRGRRRRGKGGKGEGPKPGGTPEGGSS